ncbi:MAG: Glu-tRNA(Gln) amidotransferase subunit GatD [Candidatus Nezhaarchaeales archaeon]
MARLEGYYGYALSVLEKVGAQVYDKVRVVKGLTAYEGLLMPLTTASDRYVVLKLENGYNVGLTLTDDTRIELIEKGVERIPELPPIPLREVEGLPPVSIISTGGTIASRVDYKTGAVYPALSAQDLYSVVPEIGDMANIKAEVLFSLLSEDMHPKYWAAIAERAAKHINEGVRGVVITHGTDTMSYTAAALSFALQNLPVPVVLTGAQRSSDRPSSDAALNLLSAVIAAAKGPFAEVVVIMHGEPGDTFTLLHRGTKVRKCHTSRRDAFTSINSPPLGKVEKGSVIMLTDDYSRRKQLNTLTLKASFDERVALVKTYPGIAPEALDFYIDKGFHGIVIEGTGLGHTPSYLFPQIKRAIEEGIPVVMTSQCLWGRINMQVYRTGVDLYRMGVIPGEDMLPEVALVKLMWTLGQTRDPQEVRRIMLTNIAGEINPRSCFYDF